MEELKLKELFERVEGLIRENHRLTNEGLVLASNNKNLLEAVRAMIEIGQLILKNQILSPFP